VDREFKPASIKTHLHRRRKMRRSIRLIRLIRQLSLFALSREQIR
jgi:hypothetical protein